jgi:hypothetical protein
MEIAKDLRDITKKDAKESYEELKGYQVKEPDFSRVGLKALDFFFLHHRIKAKTKGISFYEAIKDAEERALLNELVRRYKKKSVGEYDATGLLKAQYQVFQLYYGSINQFRPTIARWIYSTLNAKRGILDFSSGWGGRCLAAMSMGTAVAALFRTKDSFPAKSPTRCVRGKPIAMPPTTATKWCNQGQGCIFWRHNCQRNASRPRLATTSAAAAIR